MTQVSTGNGHGAGRQKKAPPAPPPPPPASTEVGSRVSFQMADGTKLQGTLSRVTRHVAIFELYSPAVTPRFSEALGEFTIVMQSRPVYSGRAVVSKILDLGAKIVCEVMLDVIDWQDLNLVLALQQEGQIAREFKNFLNDWQRNYKVSSDFKVAVADMQSFFNDLQLLLNQNELKLQAWPPAEKQAAEMKMLLELEKVVIPLMDFLFEKFEVLAEKIEGDQRAFHMRYIRQHLHPLILTAPFANRTFIKPRGYAGDYEMVNMIGRNGFEGNSLFAKIVHRWFVRQAPAEAHRNRVKYLAECIEKEVNRVFQMNRPARIFNFACGPAIEVQYFVRDSILADHAEFTMADFDDETLGYTQKLLNQLIARRELDTLVRFEKKPVHQLLKDRQKTMRQGHYDFVYCAGLFDYLPNTTCKQLMDIFYGYVAPGGLLLATNVSTSNPSTNTMEHVLDWHLIYRDEKDMRLLTPTLAHDDDVRVHGDSTAVNLFLEIRKP